MHFTKSSSSKTDQEKLDQSYALMDVLMEEVWGKADAEYDALDKFQNKVHNFFEDHKNLRKVRNSHYPCSPRAPRRIFKEKIQLGALRVATRFYNLEKM